MTQRVSANLFYFSFISVLSQYMGLKKKKKIDEIINNTKLPNVHRIKSGEKVALDIYYKMVLIFQLWYFSDNPP
jgi:hypothetical protein